MTTTFSRKAGVAAVILVCMLAYAFALSANADVRDSVQDREAARGGSVTPTTPAPSPVPTPKVPTGKGINTTISGSANSGGNSGGNVTTGDQKVEVFVSNTGGANSNTTVTVGPAPQPPAPSTSACQAEPRCAVRTR